MNECALKLMNREEGIPLGNNNRKGSDHGMITSSQRLEVIERN